MDRTLRVVVFSFLFASFGFAQKITQPVELGILATDDHGDAVEGLTASDFSTTCGGKSVTPVVKAELTVAPAPPTQNRDSNKGFAAARRGLTVLVLDTLHTRADQESNIRTNIAKFISDAAAKNQPVTLLQLSPSGLRMIYEYGASDPSANAARMEAFMKGSGINAGYTDSKMHAYPEAVLNMFYTVGQANRGIPGRKALVWFTNIVPLEIDRKSKLLVSPVSVGQGASVLGDAMPTKQTLLGDKELRELNASWKRAINSLVTTQTVVIPVELRGASQSGSISETLSAMKDLAVLTGGREIHGSNNPLANLEHVLRPPTTYTVTIPSDAPCAREFCELTVSAHRAANTLAPQGIFRQDSLSPIPQAEQLSRALNSPLNFQELGFAVEMSVADHKLSFRTALEPSSGVIDTTSSSVSVEVGLNVLLPDGTSKQKASFNAAGTLPPEAVKQITENGMNVKGAIELPPGEYDLKFVVHDKLHDRYGSVVIHKKIA